MELKFSQGLNKFLNSKWGGNGARIAWVSYYYYYYYYYYMGKYLILRRENNYTTRKLCSIQHFTSVTLNLESRRLHLSKKIKADMSSTIVIKFIYLFEGIARLWITSFPKSNRTIWINLMTYGGQKRLPALIFGINILNLLMTKYIKREEEKFIL